MTEVLGNCRCGKPAVVGRRENGAVHRWCDDCLPDRRITIHVGMLYRRWTAVPEWYERLEMASDLVDRIAIDATGRLLVLLNIQSLVNGNGIRRTTGVV